MPKRSSANVSQEFSSPPAPSAGICIHSRKIPVRTDPCKSVARGTRAPEIRHFDRFLVGRARTACSTWDRLRTVIGERKRWRFDTSETVADSARIGIVTISDRASRGEYQDRGGPAIRTYLEGVLTSVWSPVSRVIADERPLIEHVLKSLCDDERCCLVVTTGGTGPASRDVTPEATEAVCEKMMPGFGELMHKFRWKRSRLRSFRVSPPNQGRFADRQPSGPATAIAECLDAIFPRSRTVST